MSERNFWTIILMVLTLPLEQVHQFYCDVAYDIHILLWPYPLDVSWFVMLLTDYVSHVVQAVIFYRLSRMNHTMRLVTKCYLVVRCFNLVMFFVDGHSGKHVPYNFIYLVLGVMMALFAHNRRKKKRADLAEETPLRERV